MKFRIRELKKEDFPDIYKLALKGWYFAYSHIDKKDIKKLVDKYFSKKELSRALKEVEYKKRFYGIATRNSEVLGFCEIAIKQNAAEIMHFYVNPKTIRKGIGSVLLNEGERFIKSKKIKKYFTFVNGHNKIGLNFYNKKGFVRVPKKDKDDEFENKILWYIEKSISS